MSSGQQKWELTVFVTREPFWINRGGNKIVKEFIQGKCENAPVLVRLQYIHVRSVPLSIFSLHDFILNSVFFIYMYYTLPLSSPSPFSYFFFILFPLI